MNRLRWIQLLFVCAIGYFIFAGNSNGRATVSNSGNTGAPGENTCGQCHSGGNYNASVTVQMFAQGATVPTTQFFPGTTYTVKVTVNNAMGSPGGYAFQLTALTSAENLPISGYSNLASNVKQKTITIQNAFTGRTYLEHNGVTLNNVFQFSWTAPQNLNEAVTFYASGNVVNGTGSTSGDATNTTSLIVFPSLQVSSNVEQPSCSNNGIGSISLNISGGQPPYNVVWQNGTNGTSISGGPGQYLATITDDAGNTTTLPIELFNFTSLQIESTTTNVSCNGLCDGSINLNFISGTGPYLIQWSDGSVGGNNLPNLCAGIYTAEVTDANGCTFVVQDTIFEPAPFTNSPDVQDVACHGDLGGWIFHNIQGGTAPYTYSWDYDPLNFESSVIYLYAGDYSTTVTDANGCQYQETLTVNQPDTLSYSVELFIEGGLGVGEVQMTTYGGTPPYSWNWLHGDTNEDTFIPEVSTSYCIIGDANGCAIQTDNFTTLTSVNELEMSFTIFPQPAREHFTISQTTNFDEARIFNATGQEVKRWNKSQLKRELSVEELPSGMYILQLKKGQTILNRNLLIEH
ncbi:MAG: choice-of-anchor V domain-containing protein [Flavobacteriales bacterium]